MPEVGICEDDDALAQLLRTAVERAGWRVRSAASGTQAVQTFTGPEPDVLVMDVGLPDADGRDVCRALRARGVRAPVLFLTARDTLSDKLSGFHAGGDDYLTKPFAIAELLVRLDALARRAEGSQPQRSEATSLDPRPLGALLDPADHAVLSPRPGAGNTVRLTPTEYRLLGTLCSAGGAVVRRRSLIAGAWPDGAMVSDNTLDAYVSRIRAKLRRAGRSESVQNVRGVGYALR